MIEWFFSDNDDILLMMFFGCLVMLCMGEYLDGLVVIEYRFNFIC